MSMRADFCEDHANIAAAFEDCHRFIRSGRVERRVAAFFHQLDGFHPDNRFNFDDQYEWFSQFLPL